MKRLLLALALLVAVTACDPAPPKATITATPAAKYVAIAHDTYISGKVTPAGATPKVVLQRTVGGKWVDLVERPTSFLNDKPVLRSAAVNPTTGAYKITMYPGTYSVLHLRVRSNGGTVVSPSFYVTPI
jgi:hypothetical protein